MEALLSDTGIVIVGDKVYYGGKVYDGRLDTNLGGRLTDCCESFSTIDDPEFGLYCKSCYKEVNWGEGDGSEVLNAKFKIDEKTNMATEAYIEKIPSWTRLYVAGSKKF